MLAESHLAKYNVTLEQAQEFIYENLDNLQHILNVCEEFGVSNKMLAEIYDPFGNTTAQDVLNFFSFYNYDSSYLDPSIVGTWYAQDLSDGIGTQRITFNEDGTYTSIDTVSRALEGEKSGVETGNYSFNADYYLSTTVSAENDLNGQLGLNDSTDLNISFVDDKLTIAFQDESIVYDKVTASDRAFTYEQLIGKTVYDLFEENGERKTASFKFLDSVSGVAGEGLSSSPNQFDFSYFIDANGLLHMSINDPEDPYTIAGIVNSYTDPYEYDQLFWTNDASPDGTGLEAAVAKIIEQQNSDEYTEEEFFFYDLTSLNQFIS